VVQIYIKALDYNLAQLIFGIAVAKNT